jgi:2-keto-4-pentenoate hydratase
MNATGIEKAAQILAATRLGRTPLGSLPEDCRPDDERGAYLVQDALHAMLTVAGLGEVAGYKIGCTTPVMQRFMKIDHPCAGGIFAGTVYHEAGRFRFAEFCRVGVECEIVVRLGRDLPADRAPYTRDGVAAAVEALMAGIEVVDDRYQDFRSLDVWTMAADDFFNAGCVLGAPVTDFGGLDLASLSGRMTVNGVEVGQGQGRDILGHPLQALAWYANLKARQGQALPAGAFVMLGSIVETKWLQAGDEVEVFVEGLGHARAAFN